MNIHSNSLTSLPAELGRLSKLENLSAGYNSITQLPPEIRGLTSLHTVNLSNNQIAQFPNELLGLWQLAELRLDSNQITQLPPEIGQLSNLRTLSVRGNGLMSLPAELGQLSNLVELWAGNNSISELPPEMGEMISLGSLDLTYNQISQFPEKFLELEHVYQINLNYNHFVGPSKWEWVVNQDFTNSNQTAELESQQVAQGGQLEYTKLIPTFVQQLQGWNGGVLQGKWIITPPSGEALVLPAATGEEMNSYIFEQQGRYTVLYAVGAGDGYWFSDGMFWSNGVSNLTYTTSVLVGEEPEPSETFLDYFPDANLAQAVAEVVGKNNTDETTPEELAGITQLSADSRGITSIKGIEHLTGLTSLKLGGNQIIEVPLETGSLQLLRTLDLLRNNQISSLPAEIGSLTNLVNLYVNSNQLTGLPLELNNSTTLRQVYAQNNVITQPVPEIVFTLNSSNTFLQRQTATLPSIVTDWTAIEYRMLLPEFVLQLQAHNNGKLVGTWTITFPDGTRSIVPAVEGSEIAADLFKQEGMYTVVYSTGSMGYTAGTLRVTNLEYTIAVEIGSPLVKPIQPGEYIGTGNGIMHTTLGDLPASCSHIAARISETQLQLSFYFDTAFMQTTLNLVSMDSTTGTATYEALINGESWRVIITPDGRLNGTVELVDIPLITHYSISFQLT